MEETLALFPDYAEAWNNLGVQRLKLGDLSAAAEAFSRGIEINPHLPRLKINLATARLNQHRYGEAAKLANEALALEGSPAAHYTLGAALLLGGEELDRAVEHLRRGADVFPRAHAMLAEAALRRGDQAQALKELEQYLPRAPEPLKAEVRARISALREE